ncbi:MAG TPA: crossover junction endodeoxyribonuclease RuvC [Candidatus Andersenbacteria bacterium]|nr:crossover junction endodeoxyribonuclease RuvC [Candidatus Andersenbacteria bacterium]
MIIIGLDPGIARTGYGVIDTSQKQRFIRCGCITTPKTDSIETRLASIAADITQLIREHRPSMAVVEEIFFGANAKTAITTAHVRGVILYVLQIHNIPIQSLTPLQIKNRLTGYGAASKEQVQHAIKQQLQLTEIPRPDDAADGLAAALSAIERVSL